MNLKYSQNGPLVSGHQEVKQWKTTAHELIKWRKLENWLGGEEILLCDTACGSVLSGSLALAVGWFTWDGTSQPRSGKGALVDGVSLI